MKMLYQCWIASSLALLAMTEWGIAFSVIASDGPLAFARQSILKA